MAGTVRPVSIPRKQDPSHDDKRVLGSLLSDGEPTPESEWVELVHRIASRDQSALRDLYARTHSIVFTLALRILNDSPTAEEVTLDVYHGVWERAATYEPERGTVVGWIMNQARSRAIDRVRHESRKKRVDTGKADVGGLDEDSVASPMDERRERLESALEALTIDERRALETAYFDELTYAEVAERLEVPLGTIKTRIRSALAKLRTLLPHKEDA
jgi:RNA polymerase sigma-70 factor (ECF subfamily)